MPGSAASPARRSHLTLPAPSSASRLCGALLRAHARRRRSLARRAGSQVEYKYVVRNGDGTPTAWKPGSNFQLPLQSEGGGGGSSGGAAAFAAGLPGALRVSDAWDESWRRVEARRPAAICASPACTTCGDGRRAACSTCPCCRCCCAQHSVGTQAAGSVLQLWCLRCEGA